MFKRLKERWKKAWTADNIVDLSVDVFLIVFDVLSSPILIVMRVVRWIINKFFIDYIKAGVRTDIEHNHLKKSIQQAVKSCS